jgi:hypothetical protein
MRKYAVEVTYLVPRFKHVIIEAESPDEACQRALDSPWHVTDRVNGLEVIKVEEDHCNEDYVTGLWATEDPEGDPEPYRSPLVEVPEQYPDMPFPGFAADHEGIHEGHVQRLRRRAWGLLEEEFQRSARRGKTPGKG